jgi:hypothetical protein
VVRIHESPQLLRRQGPDSEGEWNDKADKPEIEDRRVYHHGPVLQQRIQPPAVGRRESLHGAVRKHAHQLVEGIREEDVQNQEKSQVQHQYRNDIRHHVPEPVAVLEYGDAAESCRYKHPEQHGAVMSPPERGYLIENRQIAIGGIRDVGNGKVARQQQEQQAPQRESNADCGCNGGSFGASDNPVLPLGRAKQRCENGIHRETQRQEKTKTAKTGHK